MHMQRPVKPNGECSSDPTDPRHRRLLKDAPLRTSQAADIGRLRALIVHAKDAQAKAFYEEFGFESSPLDEFHLMLLLKDVRKVVMGERDGTT